MVNDLFSVLQLKIYKLNKKKQKYQKCETVNLPENILILVGIERSLRLLMFNTPLFLVIQPHIADSPADFNHDDCFIQGCTVINYG
jgi:hypothetical protein